jgi:hypothetical protein
MKPTSLNLAVAVLFGLAATQAVHATDALLTGDASVNSAHPTTNYGALSNLYVGNGTTSLLQFDLSVLPSGTTASQVSRATLRLYVNRVNTAGSVTVSPVTSSWTESTVTYATIPAIGSNYATFTASTPGTFISVDVTSLVQGWVTTPASNYGLALTSAAANVLLDSKENDPGHPGSQRCHGCNRRSRHPGDSGRNWSGGSYRRNGCDWRNWRYRSCRCHRRDRLYWCDRSAGYPGRDWRDRSDWRDWSDWCGGTLRWRYVFRISDLSPGVRG